MTESTNKAKRSDNKYITLKDIYLHYRYKWYDVNSNTVPNPYFPKSDISEHKYKLSKKEWLVIINTFIDILIEDFVNGYDYQIPLGMGNLQLKKTLIARDRTESPYNEFIVSHCDGYFPKLIWAKHMGNEKVKFKNKTLFSCILLKNVFMNKFIGALKKDRSLIYRYPTRYSYDKIHTD